MADGIEAHVMPTYARADEVFVAGQGASLRDADGREYLDFLGGIAVTALGHAHPRLTAELQDQLGRVTHLSNLFRHPYTEPVASKLCELAGMDRAFFTNSGADSNGCRQQGTTHSSTYIAHEQQPDQPAYRIQHTAYRLLGT